MVSARRSTPCVSVILLLVSCCAVISGCKPNLAGRPSSIDGPRVLAIQSQAPEAKPDDTVTYNVLYAAPLDDASTPRYDWALCNARKPLAESGAIAGVCLQPAGPDLADLGSAQQVTGQIPKDVCQVFGPITPNQIAGAPALRAEDPDTTGGYYQPVRLFSQFGNGTSEYEVGVTRLSCGIAVGASQENTLQFGKEYQLNVNPCIESVTLAAGGGDPVAVDLSGGAAPVSVNAGAKVEFTATWPDLGSDSTCDGNGSESYLYYDPVALTLVDRRESIRVSWYATDGSFDHDTTGRVESEADISYVTNDWTAPSSEKLIRFWLVIRDDRRGVNWTQFDIQIN